MYLYLSDQGDTYDSLDQLMNALPCMIKLFLSKNVFKYFGTYVPKHLKTFFLFEYVLKLRPINAELDC